MTISFNNSPLVELVVELRWNLSIPQQIGPNKQPIPIMNVSPNYMDDFFIKFGGFIFQHGFERAERMVPPNFPVVFQQPIFRYRKSQNAETTDSSVLFQAGAGIFTVNALPPYKTWSQFKPTVESGITELLKSRNVAEKDTTFSSVRLRYSDAFGPDLTNGKDIRSFIKDVFGVSLEIPSALTKKLLNNGNVKPSIQLEIPLDNGMNMLVNIAERMVNNKISVLLDTTVTAFNVDSDLAKIMPVLQSARDIIHDMFLELTKPIETLMQPV